MATFIGYNTIGATKNYVLTDFELIKRDLLNFFNIRQGEMPGRPSYGTRIWALLFEPQNEETTQILQDEIQRGIDIDPRLRLDSLDVYPQNNGILIEVAVSTVNGVGPETLLIFFDEQNRVARLV
jgi:phage baseplate assembly protein W